jgi:hypothetical protein
MPPKLSLAERMQAAPYRKYDNAPRCGLCRAPKHIREAIEAEMRKPETYRTWVVLDFLKEEKITGVTDSVLNHHRRNHLND